MKHQKDRRFIKQDALNAQEKDFWDNRTLNMGKFAQQTPLYHLDKYNSLIVEFLEPLDGKTILEIGCNTGYCCFYLADRNARVTGLDISEKSIEVAKKIKESAELRGTADFQAGIAEELPFDENSFDAVFSRDVLHHTKFDKALSEIKRVLKPNGKVVLLETTVTNPIVKFGRDRVVGRFGSQAYKNETEYPLTLKELKSIYTEFGKVTVYGIEFFRLLLRIPFLRKNTVFSKAFNWLDNMLFLRGRFFSFLSYEKLFFLEK